jgi:hypothetical protein
MFDFVLWREELRTGQSIDRSAISEIKRIAYNQTRIFCSKFLDAVVLADPGAKKEPDCEKQARQQRCDDCSISKHYHSD